MAFEARGRAANDTIPGLPLLLLLLLLPLDRHKVLAAGGRNYAQVLILMQTVGLMKSVNYVKSNYL